MSLQAAWKTRAMGQGRRPRLLTRTKERGWTGPLPFRIDGARKSAAALAALAWVAQLVEQRIENPRVGGSNPPPGTTSLVQLIVLIRQAPGRLCGWVGLN